MADVPSKENERRMNTADNIIRFLDAGFYVVMWRNQHGSYSGALVLRNEFRVMADNEPLFDVGEKCITNDMTPTKTLARLADKPLGNIKDNYVKSAPRNIEVICSICHKPYITAENSVDAKCPRCFE